MGHRNDDYEEENLSNDNIELFDKENYIKVPRPTRSWLEKVFFPLISLGLIILVLVMSFLFKSIPNQNSEALAANIIAPPDAVGYPRFILNSEADLSINNEYIGKVERPIRLAIPIGNHIVKLIVPKGFGQEETVLKRISVKEGEFKDIHFNELR